LTGRKKGFKKTKKKFWRNEIKDYLCRTFTRKNGLGANKREAYEQKSSLKIFEKERRQNYKRDKLGQLVD